MTDMVSWQCVNCEKIVLVEVQVVTRDGGKWAEAPSGWLFVFAVAERSSLDGELTHVCSRACLEEIYSKDD